MLDVHVLLIFKRVSCIILIIQIPEKLFSVKRRKLRLVKSKIPFLTEQLAERLQRGEFGRSGEPFLAVRTLAEECSISINSAFRIMNVLAEQRLIRLSGKHYYITTG